MPIITKKKKSTITLTKAGKVRKKRGRRKSGIYKGEKHFYPPIGPHSSSLKYDIFIGVDVGRRGAIVFLSPEGKFLDSLLYPFLPSGDYDIHTLASQFTELCRGKYGGLNKFCTIEKVSARPTDGRVMLASFSRSYGILLGILGSLNIPIQVVHPLLWMGQYDLFKKTKEEGSIKLCNERIDLPSHLRTHDGITDACLVGLWGMETLVRYKGSPPEIIPRKQ